MVHGKDHPRDALQDLLDGRLDAVRRPEVESHLTDCEACRAEEQALRATKLMVRSALPSPNLPHGLEADLAAALDCEGGFASRSRRTLVGVVASRRTLFVALASAAAIVMLGGLALRLSREPQSPADLATILGADFERVENGTLALSLPVNDPPELERRFAADGIAFPTHVYDLGMMGFTLVGGRVHTVAGRPSALFAYRSANGAWLTCQMYPGSAEELPEGAEVRTHNGIRFYTFRRGVVTVVLWEEGTIVCALASDLPAAQVVELALAKAMKV